jgi:large subunit ribosomal protein L18
LLGISEKSESAKKITGTSQSPRLSVYRSLKHIYAQIIDDETGNTLAAASTLSPELKAAFQQEAMPTRLNKWEH